MTRELPADWALLALIITCVFLAIGLLIYGIGKEVGKDEERKSIKHKK